MGMPLPPELVKAAALAVEANLKRAQQHHQPSRSLADPGPPKSQDEFSSDLEEDLMEEEEFDDDDEHDEDDVDEAEEMEDEGTERAAVEDDEVSEVSGFNFYVGFAVPRVVIPEDPPQQANWIPQNPQQQQQLELGENDKDEEQAGVSTGSRE